MPGWRAPLNDDPLDDGANVSWDAVGAVAEMPGGLATIATLIYLARQIRQAAEATRLQTLQAIRSTSTQLRLSAVQTEEIAALMMKAAEQAELTPTERARLNLMYAAIFDSLSEIYEAAAKGFIGDNSLELHLGSYLSQQACRDWWAKGQTLFPPEFVEHVELHVLPNLEKATPHWHPSP